MTEYWRKALDNGENIGLLSTDMSKAFDSLHHPLMLAKLKAYGLNESSLALFRSYFKDQKNRVRLKEATSAWKLATRGCPHGSNFGTMLWDIFQNDLSYNIESELNMYADDHQFYESGINLENVQLKLKESAILASEWYRENFLEGNFGKYRIMTFGKKEQNIEVELNGIKIESSDCIKLFGVDIDNRLKFNQHVSNVCTKASQRVGVLMRMKNMIPTRAKLQLYKAAILPYLIYSHTIWHFCCASDKRKLERVQERALRAVFNDKVAGYEELLRKADLPNLQNRRLQDIAILVYKAKHNLCPQYISDLFTSKNTRINLRNADINIPRFNTVNYGKHSLRYLGARIWSKLDAGVKSSATLGIFKVKIRKISIDYLMTESCRNCVLCSN